MVSRLKGQFIFASRADNDHECQPSISMVHDVFSPIMELIILGSHMRGVVMDELDDVLHFWTAIFNDGGGFGGDDCGH